MKGHSWWYLECLLDGRLNDWHVPIQLAVLQCTNHHILRELTFCLPNRECLNSGKAGRSQNCLVIFVQVKVFFNSYEVIYVNLSFHH